MRTEPWVSIATLAFADSSGFVLCKSIQSTGQGGKQSSQPVQLAVMTVCIFREAPMIASTGQASIQSVQPIQSSSRMMAVCGGL